MEENNLIQIAKNVFEHQCSELRLVKEKINETFNQCVNVILQSKGKVILIGVGKNMPIAQKIVATMNSTGTPAQFLHAGEAIHGDLGMVNSEDVLILLSKSGNTPEIKSILPYLKRISSIIIAITGNIKSNLAEKANLVLDTTIEKESDFNNLAPTASTTAQLVMGDALAIAVAKQRRFTSEDFAKYHPGGTLGKSLLWTVADIFNRQESPRVSPEDSISKVIESLSYSKNGITVLLENDLVKGVITDGDLRRMLSNYETFNHIKAKDIATLNPKTIKETEKASVALNILNRFKIGQLVVTNTFNQYVGILDLHDLLKEGINE